MKLTLLGLGAALIVALPVSASAQRPEKPVVKREPVLKRGNPTAAPKASPAATTTTGAATKGEPAPAARPTGEAEPPEDDTGGTQGRALRGSGENAVSQEGIQSRAAQVSEGDPEEEEVQALTGQISEGDPEEDEGIQGRAGQVSEGDPDEDEDIQAQPGMIGAPGQAQSPGQAQVPGQGQPGTPGGVPVRP